MPAIGSNSRVLVTGGSGFVATWCIYQLLERGHQVRATVRSDSKGQYLHEVFHNFGDQLSFIVVENLEEEGSFSKAVKGVDAVLHTASPFLFEVDGDPERALIRPAVNGTRNVLDSIHTLGKDVKRVVITSSYAAIVDPSREGPNVYTEHDWNTSSVENARRKGKGQDGGDAYLASKTMAERTAWEFVDKMKPAWDLVTINPSLVLGPILQQVGSPEKLNTSTSFVWGLLHGSKDSEDLLAPSGAFVDVRDVAYAHVESLVRSEAGGNRFLLSRGPLVWQDFVDVLHKDSSLPPQWKSQVPVGKPGQGSSVKQHHDADGSKASRMLGLNYLSLPQTVQDTVASLIDYERRDWTGVPSNNILSRSKH